MAQCVMCRNQFQLPENEIDCYTIEGKNICPSCAEQIDTLLNSEEPDDVHRAINYIYACQQQATDTVIEMYLKELLDNNANVIDEIIEKKSQKQKEQRRLRNADSPVQFDKSSDYFQDKNGKKSSVSQSNSSSGTNGLQIAGFVVSLVSCFIFGYYGITGIVGIVLSFVGCLQAEKNGGKTGFGTAGIIIGIISAIGAFLGARYYNNLIWNLLH